MRISSIRLIILSLCLFLLAPASVLARSDQPEAVQGVLDLSRWSLAEQGDVELGGEWQFFWQQFLEPGPGQALTASSGSIVKVPHVWGTHPETDPATEHYGYGTYRLRVRFAPEEAGTLKALYIPAVASAYTLWINGKQVEHNGRIGTSKETMAPKNYAKVVHFTSVSGDNEIVLQVSNYVQRKGGLWTMPILGDDAHIALKRETNLTSQLFITLVLLTLGCYHLALHFMRKRDHLSLLLGTFCTLFALRSILLGDTLLVRFFPGLSWEWAVKLEYLSPDIAVPLFALFVHLLYPQEFNRKLVNGIMAVGSMFCLLILFTPASVYTWTMNTYQLFTLLTFGILFYVFILAAIRKREGAVINGAACVILLAAGINDMLYYNQLIESIDFAPYGVLVFFFAQTLIVARRFAKAYDHVVELSGELRDVNLVLEKKIRERTAELEASNAQLREANDHLYQTEQSRQKLISNISHELGTPMTTVQGYVKAWLDGKMPRPERPYIQMIYDKVLMVNRLVQDLFETSKMESGEINIALIEMPAEDLFESYFRGFQYEVEEAGIRFEMEAAGLSSDNDRFAILSIDPIRIQQVVGNLVFNAVKFTPAGGTIRIAAALTEGEHDAAGWLAVSVSDTGAGIAKDAQPHLFDRFYKVKGAEPLRGKRQGSGLGLAIAKEIVGLHGGTIRVESEPGQGSTFTFELPVQLLSVEVM
ncbi:sensor histidine kinase [Paenibacillus cremeus]|uniref:histidine kinase n=1 Tax=Paenibacillus cremeus TaxID=2163881 RepID=A0A559K6C8_9BACL|nr:sensor histidine kinase [Paenibacillus cremeus]TVY07698.1 hypothetical protein FPZ49_22730 [Paenibacillus cremeus]